MLPNITFISLSYWLSDKTIKGFNYEAQEEADYLNNAIIHSRASPDRVFPCSLKYVSEVRLPISDGIQPDRKSVVNNYKIHQYILLIR